MSGKDGPLDWPPSVCLNQGCDVCPPTKIKRRRPNPAWQLVVGLKDALWYFWLKTWWEWVQMRKEYPDCICPLDVYLGICPEHGNTVNFYRDLKPEPSDVGGNKSECKAPTRQPGM